MFLPKAAFTAGLLLLVIPSAPAAFSPGDILVNDFGFSKITQYSPSGTIIRTFTAPQYSIWTGTALTPDGNVVTTFREDTGLQHAGFLIFRPDGSLVTAQRTPELDQPGTIPGDVTVFPDGTLAIADQFQSKVRLYTQTGTLVRTITSPSISHPFGGALALDNTLWVGDIQTNSFIQFGEDGTTLNTLALGFTPGDIATVPGDGSFWTPEIHLTGSSSSTVVRHVSSTGVTLSSFTFTYPNTGGDIGIALADDGSLYLDVTHNATLFHYSTSGSLLGSFFLPNSFDPTPSQIFPEIITVIPTPAPEPSSLSLLIGASFILAQKSKAGRNGNR